MALVINHNMMALSAARSLNTAYAGLSKSVRRLSSGLRVTQSGDDAAGLSIRELMRAEVAALNQGGCATPTTPYP
jgi:flagellin